MQWARPLLAKANGGVIMKRTCRGLLLLPVFLLFSSSLQSADRDDVDQLLDRYMAAYNGGDATALAALYARDAVLLPHEEGSARGRAEIESFWKRTLRLDPARRIGRRVWVMPVAKKAGTDVAFVVATLGSGSGDSRNFVLCLARDTEGKWQIASELWNLSGPRVVPAV
jgi:uncharacterized protein (TIGR02246 family)